MKKILALILASIICLSLFACGNDDDNQDNENNALSVKITIGTVEFDAILYDNETAKALADMLPLTLNMSELNGNEKYYYLPENLPTDSTKPNTIQAGDIMLYGSNCLVLFYKAFSTSYSYTKIGKIENTAGLAAALGSGSVTVKFELAGSAESNEPETPNEPSEPEIPNEPEAPVEPTEPTEPEIPTEPETPIENEVTTMHITINGNTFKSKLYDNQTAKAFAVKLPLTLQMSELNNNEKYCYLPDSLPTAATSAGMIEAGDIMLWGNNCLVLFYKTFPTSYSYTKIGKIEDVSGLVEALGSSNVTVTFTIETK